MKSEDLKKLWGDEELKTAKKKLLDATKAYEALKNKDSKYAMTIKKMIESLEKVVDVWTNFLN